jgi:hypothetical protein
MVDGLREVRTVQELSAGQSANSQTDPCRGGRIGARPSLGPAEEHEQIMITRVGLRIPANLRYEDWERAGEKLVRIADTSAWCLGDWLTHGQAMYRDRYRQAVARAGLDYQTLRNYAWVSRKFSPQRRHEGLSFQHHAEVASLPTDQQDLWLQRAEDRAWSRNELRRCRHELAGSAAGPGTGAVMPRMAVPSVELQHWREAAAVTSCSLQSWLITTLNEAATVALHDGSDDLPTAV